MKHYAKFFVNKATGEIEHLAVSDAPLDNGCVGATDNISETHSLHSVEFETTDGTFMRGCDLIKSIETFGSGRGLMSASVRKKSSAERITKLVKH